MRHLLTSFPRRGGDWLFAGLAGLVLLFLGWAVLPPSTADIQPLVRFRESPIGLRPIRPSDAAPDVTLARRSIISGLLVVRRTSVFDVTVHPPNAPLATLAANDRDAWRREIRRLAGLPPGAFGAELEAGRFIDVARTPSVVWWPTALRAIGLFTISGLAAVAVARKRRGMPLGAAGLPFPSGAAFPVDGATVADTADPDDPRPATIIVSFRLPSLEVSRVRDIESVIEDALDAATDDDPMAPAPIIDGHGLDPSARRADIFIQAPELDRAFDAVVAACHGVSGVRELRLKGWTGPADAATDRRSAVITTAEHARRTTSVGSRSDSLKRRLRDQLVRASARALEATGGLDSALAHPGQSVPGRQFWAALERASENEFIRLLRPWITAGEGQLVARTMARQIDGGGHHRLLQALVDAYVANGDAASIDLLMRPIARRNLRRLENARADAKRLPSEVDRRAAVAADTLHTLQIWREAEFKLDPPGAVAEIDAMIEDLPGPDDHPTTA